MWLHSGFVRTWADDQTLQIKAFVGCNLKIIIIIIIIIITDEHRPLGHLMGYSYIKKYLMLSNLFCYLCKLCGRNLIFFLPKRNCLLLVLLVSTHNYLTLLLICFCLSCNRVVSLYLCIHLFVCWLATGPAILSPHVNKLNWIEFYC